MSSEQPPPGSGIRSRLELNPWVSGAAVTVIGLFVLVGVLVPDRAESAFTAVQDVIADEIGWFSILSVTGFLAFSVWLAVGRHGRIRLGDDDERPTYSYWSWFAMLFSAGMGIGLLFYGVAEPVLHYATPVQSEPETAAAAQEALRLTFFHWGLHAWGVYVVVGASLAYFAYRQGRPLLIRSAFHPLLGDRVDGRAGDVIDTLAIFGTVFGVATSLGLGVLQINAGLNALVGLDQTVLVQVLLIAGITAAATTSVVLGLDAGIKRLSMFNLVAASLLLLFVLVVGPTRFILDGFVQGTGAYLQTLPRMTLFTDAFGDGEWQSVWTLFYWGWWISWSPFVGMFIARISRGRTLREFVTGVLLVPSLVTFLWMSAFGGTALSTELFGAGGVVAAVQESVDVALFEVLGDLPLGAIASTLAVVVIMTFFITSSDSGSLVVDILGSGGNPDPPVPQRVFWAITEGVVAAVLLSSGGLVALQTASIITGLPFTLVLIGMCVSLAKALRAETARAEDEPTRVRDRAPRRGESVRHGDHGAHEEPAPSGTPTAG